MKARYRGKCHLCTIAFPPGEEVAKLLGRVVHVECKSDHLESKASQTTLPSNRAALERWESRKQHVKPKLNRGVAPMGWHQK